MVDDIELVGGNTAAFRKLLSELDPCFGQNYAKTVLTCRECICPVIVNGKVELLNDVCREATRQNKEKAKAGGTTTVSTSKGGAPPTLNKMSYADVSRALQAGKTWFDLFVEVLGDADPEEYATDAREFLYGAQYYIRKTWDLPVAKVPKRKELLAHVRN